MTFADDHTLKAEFNLKLNETEKTDTNGDKMVQESPDQIIRNATNNWYGITLFSIFFELIGIVLSIGIIN